MDITAPISLFPYNNLFDANANGLLVSVQPINE
jgi:hypothetical protein